MFVTDQLDISSTFEDQLKDTGIELGRVGGRRLSSRVYIVQLLISILLLPGVNVESQ